LPQAERTQNIIKLLMWLRDVQESATRGQIISYTKMEITSMGATERTAISYLEVVREAQPLKTSTLIALSLLGISGFLLINTREGRTILRILLKEKHKID